MRNLSLLLSLLILPVVTSAQAWTSATSTELVARLDRSAAQFNAMDHFRLQSTIMAFRNTTDDAPQETETSTVWKMGDKAKAEHMGLVSYQNTQVRVTVIPEDRVLMVAEPQSFFDVLGKDYKMLVLSSAKSIDKREQDGSSRYRVRFAKGSDYELIEFTFDEGAWLRRVECWWGNSIALEPDNPLTALVTPKVVLEMERPVRLTSTAIAVDPSLAIVRQGNELVPTPAYAGYEIVDNRLNP
jgi:hypothetical protein